MDIKRIKNAVRMNPKNPRLLLNLAEAQMASGSLDDALATFNKTLKVKPDEYQAYSGIGQIVAMKGDMKGSVQWFMKSFSVKQNTEAYRLLGYVLGELCDYEPAMQCLQYVLDHEAKGPERANASLNYGNALFRNGKLIEAIPYFEQSLPYMPDLSNLNLGICYFHSKQYEKAVPCLSACLSIPKARVNLSLAYFMLGQFDKGYELYESRFVDNKTLSPFEQPNIMPNDLSELSGKTLLLYAEQGLGDTLQYYRYVRKIKEYRCRVIVAVEKNMVSLVKSYCYADEVMGFGQHTPPYHYRLAMMSAPMYFGQIEPEQKYYTANSELVTMYADKMPKNGKLNIGFFWRGNPRKDNAEANFTDKMRSINLEQFDDIIFNTDVNWICLQKDDMFNEITSKYPFINFMPEVSSFEETAAIIENCDFVIGVDSSVIHLSASLGKETWMLSRWNGCWRWRLEGHGHDIYPTLRIFRQTEHANWTTVLGDLKSQLSDRISHIV